MYNSNFSLEFNTLPDYIIKYYIVPYLDSETLLFNFRTLSTHCFNCSKDSLGEVLSNEQLSQFRQLCKEHQYETLKENFHKKIEKLVEIKQLIVQYATEFNFADLIRMILEDNNEAKVVQLCKMFLSILHYKDIIKMLDENQFTELNDLLMTENCRRTFREKIANILDIEILDLQVGDFGTMYIEYDDIYLQQLDRSGNFLYSVSGKLIEFQVQKIIQHDLKLKIQKFIDLGNELTEKWNKKRYFHNNLIESSENSKTTNVKIKKMLNLFDRYEMDTPIKDFYNEYIEIDSHIYNLNNILSNRKKLNDKITRLEAMSNFYNKCKHNEKETLFIVANSTFSQIDFLKVLSNIKPSWEINEENFIKTNLLIKAYIENIQN